MRLKQAKLPAQTGQFRALKLPRSACLSPEVRRNLLVAVVNGYDFGRFFHAMSVHWPSTAPKCVEPTRGMARKRLGKAPPSSMG
eukprot:2012320-Pyramimonas_sp.AAC.1